MQHKIVKLFCLCLLVTTLSADYNKQPFKIKPGIGFSSIKLGASRNELIKEFGQASKSGEIHSSYHDNGVQCLIEKNKVTVMFLYYRSSKFITFDGTTIKGIGFNSSIPDVYRKYGEPSKMHTSIRSQYESSPGIREVWLDYNKLGITFTFWNNSLAYIRIYTPGTLYS